MCHLICTMAIKAIKQQIAGVTVCTSHSKGIYICDALARNVPVLMNLWSNPPWHVPTSVARVKRRLTAVWNCWPGKMQLKLRWFANKTFLWTFHKQIWLISKLFNDYHCDLECLDVLDWIISKMFVSGFLDGFVAGCLTWSFNEVAASFYQSQVFTASSSQ